MLLKFFSRFGVCLAFLSYQEIHDKNSNTCQETLVKGKHDQKMFVEFYNFSRPLQLAPQPRHNQEDVAHAILAWHEQQHLFSPCLIQEFDYHFPTELFQDGLFYTSLYA